MTTSEHCVTCVLPQHADKSLVEVVRGIKHAPTLPPFHETATRFVADLSRTILGDRSMQAFPELMALAHWFRAAHVLALKERLRHSTGPAIALAKGLVFHVAPANVDSVFVYSWLLSLLCGNPNVVRISRRPTKQITVLIKTVNGIMQNAAHRHVLETNVVLTYEHDVAISTALSSICHLRVIWGGDATVSHMRTIPVPALSSELAFPNRFSLAVLASNAVMTTSAAELKTLSHRFYNDTFWFNQQACSSPRAIVWIGTPQDTTAAKSRFWSAVGETIHDLQPADSASAVMDRLTTSYRIAQSHATAVLVSPPGALPARIATDTLQSADRECHDGNGLFIEVDRRTLSEVPALLTPIDQTIATFGFAREEWLSVLPAIPPHAADRIVAIGSALEFDSIWDGNDLLRCFTRSVVVT